MFNIFKVMMFVLIIGVSGKLIAQDVYLPEPVKEQSGFYLVSPDYIFNFSTYIPSTGVAIEIYDPGEPHNIIDYTIPNKFIFGGFFDSMGYYITFQGEIDSEVPNTFNVVLAYTQMGLVQILGSGTIKADPYARGNSHIFAFSFNFNERYSFYPDNIFYGEFHRISGNTIKKCLPVFTYKYPNNDFVDCHN